MRRNLSIASSALALGAALVVCACTDLLTEDPKGFTTTDTFYKTGADLNSATIAIYNSLRGLQGQAQWTTPELASDQARADNREPNLGTSGPDFLIWDASTGNTGAYWGTAYSIITRANLVLANGPGIDAPNAQMKAYNLAEAKLLRGYAYLWLVKVYDDVPLLLSPADQANPRPTRTPVEQVDQAIIKDLTEAEAALPTTWPSSDGYGNPTQGRVTKGAAQMALADLYQWRSSFMLKNEWQLASGWASTTAYVWGGCSVSGLCPTFNDTVKHVIRHDTLADGPMPYKYRKSDNGVNWMLNDVDTPLYRFAEAIVMYAEAQNELGNTGVAVQYLNMIRARARKGTGAETRAEPHDYGTAGEPLDQLSVRDAIYMERAWEFAFEAKRWFDLVRRDSRESGFWRSSLEGHDSNSWNPLGGTGRPLPDFKKRFPIPQTQINANPALTQNPGY